MDGERTGLVRSALNGVIAFALAMLFAVVALSMYSAPAWAGEAGDNGTTPVAAASEEPKAESTSDAAAEPAAKPAAESAAKSAAEPASEPASEPVAEPVEEPAEEPVAEPTPEAEPEPATQVVDEPTAEQAVDGGVSEPAPAKKVAAPKLLSNSAGDSVEPQSEGDADADGNYVFEDGKVAVNGVGYGTVTYTPDTKTLALADVYATEIVINGIQGLIMSITGYAQYESGWGDLPISITDADVTLTGSGKLYGYILLNSDTARLVIDGCTVDPEDGYYADDRYYAIYGGAFKPAVHVANGSINGRVMCGDFTMDAGSVDGDVSCANLTMDAGSVDGDISCTNFTMNGGTVVSDSYYGGITCTGDCTVHDGTVDGVITCVNFTMDGGAISGHYDDDGDVICSGSFNMSGGSIEGCLRLDNDSLDASFSAPVASTVQYDAANKVLTVNDAKANRVEVNGDVTICVNGTLQISDDNSDGDRAESIYVLNGALTLTGTGTVYGVEMHSWDDDPVTISLILDGCTITNNINGNYSGCTSYVTINSGVVNGSVWCDNLTMNGGTVNGGVCPDYSERGAITMTGGTINGGVKCTDLAISNGVIAGPVYCEGNLTMRGGKITVSGGDEAIRCYNFTMSGGTISITNADYGLRVGGFDHTTTYTFKISGGTITVTSPSYQGIYTDRVNLVMTGGTVKVTDAHEHAIWVSSTTYRSKTYGGKITVTGGALTATVHRPSEYSAIVATSMTNKLGCLKTIKGALPTGASFKAAGNLYKVVDGWGNSGEVRLVSYGANKKSFTFNKVNFGGAAYKVRYIGKNAFNTKAGKKVKKLTFGGTYGINLDTMAFNNAKKLKTLVIKTYVDNIGAYAFKNTKSLTSLAFGSLPFDKYKYAKNGRLKSVSFYKSDYQKVFKKAFKKCGKSGGKKLTVTLYVNNKPKGVFYRDVKAYKKLFKKYGLSGKAKFKTYK